MIKLCEISHVRPISVEEDSTLSYPESTLGVTSVLPPPFSSHTRARTHTRAHSHTRAHTQTRGSCSTSFFCLPSSAPLQPCAFLCACVLAYVPVCLRACVHLFLLPSLSPVTTACPPAPWWRWRTQRLCPLQARDGPTMKRFYSTSFGFCQRQFKL